MLAGRFDQVGQQIGVGLEARDPSPRADDRQMDADGIEQRLAPRAARHDRGVGLDDAVVGDHAAHRVVTDRERPSVQMVPDRGAALGGGQRHRHREGARVHAMAVVDQPAAGEVAGERGFGVADRDRGLEFVDGHAVGACHGHGGLRGLELLAIVRHQDHAHRFRVQADVDRRLGCDLQVAGQGGLGHGQVRLVLGQDPQALVAAGRVGGQVVAFDQRDGGAALGEFECACGADHASTHDDHVGHGAKPSPYNRERRRA